MLRLYLGDQGITSGAAKRVLRLDIGCLRFCPTLSSEVRGVTAWLAQYRPVWRADKLLRCQGLS